MTRLERLDAVIALLSDERRWTQRAYARNARDVPVKAQAPSAVRWCLDGASIRTTELTYQAGCFALAFPEVAPLLAIRDARDYIQFNDTSTHAEVMAFLADLRAAVAASDGAAAP